MGLDPEPNKDVICGVDEAGRGPIAGPVTAAAVILPPDFPREILADSKALTPAQRRCAAAIIKDKAVSWAVGWSWPEEIDRINILQATLVAMCRAIGRLSVQPARVLVDGNQVPAVSIPCVPIVKGDATVPEIMAASIIAKTTRDAWMEEYAKREPAYGFERHKGYPTDEHREIVLRIGPSAIQRKSFRVSAVSPVL